MVGWRVRGLRRFLWGVRGLLCWVLVGWPVGAEYVDNDVSAFSGKPRREYARMLADLESGARDAVIVYNLDRLHRRPAEFEEFVALCERVGVSQVATVTADIDLGKGGRAN